MAATGYRDSGPRAARLVRVLRDQAPRLQRCSPTATGSAASTRSCSAAAGGTPRTMSARSFPAAAPTACMPPTSPPHAAFRRGSGRPFFASSVGGEPEPLCRRHDPRRPPHRATVACGSTAATRRCSRARRRPIPGFPTLLPAIVAPGEDKMIDLSLLSPRVGVSYALDDSGPHAAARQLRDVRIAARQRHRAGVLGGVAGDADLLGHRSQRQQRRRSRRARCAANFGGVDPANPGRGVNFNRVDPDLKAPKTHEFVVGIDRELMPQFGVSAVVLVAAVQRRDLERPATSRTGNHRVSAGRRHPRRLRSSKASSKAMCPASALTGASSTRRPSRACRRATAAEFRNRPGLSPAVPRLRSAGDQAAVEPLDGARRLLDQPAHRALRRHGRHAGSGCVHDVAEHRRRRVRDRHRRAAARARST